MPSARHFLLTLDGIASPLVVVVLRGHERVHDGFRFELTALHTDDGAVAKFDPEALVGQKAKLSFEGDTPRVIHGIVDEVRLLFRGARLSIVPALAVLDDSVDYRVFLDQDAPTIAESILVRRGLKVDKRLSVSYAPRPQRVQSFESDLAFVRRILAEEGVLLHLEHGDADATVVFSDAPTAYLPIAGADSVAYSTGDLAGLVAGESVSEASLNRAVVSDKLTLRDGDFKKPMLDLTVSAGSGALERYEHPGGYVDPGVGSALAKARLDEAQRFATVLRGQTTCRRFSPGSTFKLTDAGRDEMNATWLIVSVEHAGSDGDAPALSNGRRYQASFVAVPIAIPHRPERLDAPPARGVENAVVTGASGAEIHPDSYGRIKAHLRWDRLRPVDDTSSAWLRPIQPPTSGGFLLPRTGWEVLLGFSTTSADVPYEIGRLVNGQVPPAESLPGQKVRSAFGTMTTPGGGSANLLRMDDAAGNEGMTLQASRDYNERTENDKSTTVQASDTRTVGSNLTHIVGLAHGVTVDGAQNYDVGANRDLTAVGNYSISAASESVGVGAVRYFKVGGDYQTLAGTLIRSVVAAESVVAIQEAGRHVTGVSTVIVGGGWTEIGGITASTSVLGASALNVGGPLSVDTRDYSLKANALSESYASKKVHAGGKRVEVYTGAVKYDVTGTTKVKAAGVYFKADSKITLKGSGTTITITSSKIEIDGDYDSSEASVITGDDASGS